MLIFKKSIIFVCVLGVLLGVSWWSVNYNLSTPEKNSMSQVPLTHSIQGGIVNNSQQPKTKLTKVNIGETLEKLVPWQMGTEYNYNLLLVNKMVMIGKSSNEQQTIGISLDGNLALAVIEEDMKSIMLRVKLNDLNVQLKNNVNNTSVNWAKAKQKLQSNLNTPIYLVLERNGRVKSVHIPSELPTTSATLLRSIASNLQFIHPQRLKRTWQYTEQDHVGEYKAQYQRIDQGIYGKNKSSYDKIVTPEGLVATQTLGGYKVDSLSTFSFDQQLGLKSISATEMVSAQVMDGFQIDTHQDIELSLLNTEEITAKIPGWVKTMKQIEATHLASIVLGEDPHIKSQERLLNNADLNTLMAELRLLDFTDEETKATDQEIIAVRRKLTALFAVHPDTAEQAVVEFEKDMNIEQLSVLAGALASAETPQAQSVLGDVALKENLGIDLRMTSLALLGMSVKPTERTVDTLFMLQKADDENLATTANLALGGLSETMAKQNPETAEQIVDSLLQNFEKSDSVETRLVSLEALGNTGDERIIPGIETVLKEGSEVLRTSGVEALRFVKSEKAIELISNTLNQDAQSGVRQAAIRAMDYHPIEKFIPNLVKVAHNDEDSSVRLEIVDRTGERLSEHSEGKELLTWLADNDPDPTVREHAVEHVCNFNPDACVDETQFN